MTTQTTTTDRPIDPHLSAHARAAKARAQPPDNAPCTRARPIDARGLSITRNMDGTAEGIQQAAATREALRKRRRADSARGRGQDEQEEEEEQGGAPAAGAPPAAQPSSSEPTCTHEVAVPEGYDPSAVGLDPDVYGE